MAYERFTVRAKSAMKHAHSEAMRLNHEYIGSEHVLLGLLKEGGGVAAKVLKRHGFDIRAGRNEVVKLSAQGPDIIAVGRLPETPTTKRIIELAMDLAKKYGHTYVGTEHLILSIVQDPECVASQALLNHGLSLEAQRLAT